MRSFVVVAIVGALVSGSAASKPAKKALVSYDIELKFIGITGHHVGTAAQCTAPVSGNGYDLLVGTVTGNETSSTDEDIEYTGTVHRTTAMDICGIRETSPGEYVDCAATLVGGGAMTVSLEVYGEADRGAWLKAKVTRTDSANVSGGAAGSCDPPEMAEYRKWYLGGGSGAEGGGSPDGQPIEDRFSQPDPAAPGPGPLFFRGNQARLRVGYYPPDPAAGGWSLWVKRQIP